MRVSVRIQRARINLLIEGLAFAKEMTMKTLKTLLAAGALAVAAFATAAPANAAPHLGVFVGRDNVHVGFYKGRAPGHFNNWYAGRGVYRTHAWFRMNPRLRACFPVTKYAFHRGRPALIKATMCYGRNGARFVVPGSRHFVRFI
jgi:hypothetical protein